MPVSSRTIRQFLTRQSVIEKVVDRRLGFESPGKPDGWKWDQRHLSVAEQTETLPFPGIKGSHLLGIPREYWQNGPIDGDAGNSLEVSEIRRVFTDGKEYWAPAIHSGGFGIWRDGGYLFSDDSVVESVPYNSLDGGSRSVYTLQRSYRTGSPILATIFKRTDANENVPWREYYQRYSFTGTLDSDGEEQTTRDGDELYWDNVDTTKREFIPFVRDGSVFLQFNQYAIETPTRTTAPSSILDFNELEHLGVSDESEGQRFYTRYFPLSSNSLAVYVVNVTGGTWTAWTVVDEFTGSNQVKVDLELGIVIFGTVASGGVPTLGHDVYIAYKATPRIEYEEEYLGDEVLATTADVNPLGQALNRGFVVLGRAELDIASIVLETDEPSYGGESDTYGPVYVGADFASLIATVYSSSGKVVPNVEVLFELETTPAVGSLGGAGYYAERITGYDGKARTHYSPPNSANDMGFFVTETKEAGVRLDVPSDAKFKTLTDIYTYYVLKDDPWKGKVGADTSIGEIEWSGDPPNGRKVVMYKWDATAINPISGEFGAYAPVHPTSVTDGYILRFSDALTEPDSSSSTTVNLGAYWIVSDRYVTVVASAYSPRLGRRITSNSLVLRVELPAYMKGQYVNDALQRIPFGWRIMDDKYDYASAIGGATFITINPVAGPYNIVDVIAGETWEWAQAIWDYDYRHFGPFDVSRPFARLTFKFEVS